MRNSCWKGKALKQLTFHLKRICSGRNSSGRITVFHRGGGSKRLQRKIDFKRSTSMSMGIVERIEYDPNRSSWIALVRWIEGVLLPPGNNPPSFISRANREKNMFFFGLLFSFSSQARIKYEKRPGGPCEILESSRTTSREERENAPLGSFLLPRAGAFAFRRIPSGRERLLAAPLRENTFSLVSEGQRWRTHSGAIGKSLVLPWSQGPKAGNGLFAISEHTGKRRRPEMACLQFPIPHIRRTPGHIDFRGPSGVLRTSEPFTYILASDKLEAGKTVMNFHWSNKPSGQKADPGIRDASNKILDSYQMGNCIPLAKIPIGTWVHNIERNPGQGAKSTRAAGTFAQIIKKAVENTQCIVRLPSGVDKLIDSRCRATIGIVSNPNHGKRKLSKAGQSRWLGRRPIVRGVAMNPVDHPHGGGEGRTKGGRPSVSPWGKPTKGGFRTRKNNFSL
nr:ribosomal protein L2 [Apopellia endiviifolia]WIA66417.1 ribosomal protein L2 [Apopellia endiviifolia]WIA66458.1 ribosomal protein L2 [Apopellia endiviifolia]WIA66499.1 ribosomal protein L2 [Apopellia endiviifolia]WIA66540.1 ribosomal protein L2 [Apopellia endiviifolia]